MNTIQVTVELLSGTGSTLLNESYSLDLNTYKTDNNFIQLILKKEDESKNHNHHLVRIGDDDCVNIYISVKNERDDRLKIEDQLNDFADYISTQNLK